MKKAVMLGITISMMVVILASCGQMRLGEAQSALNATTTVPTMVTTTVPLTVRPTGTVNTQNKPPHVFSIHDQKKLILMRNAVTDDEALQQFLKEDSSAVMKNREDVSAFLKLLDSLPNLVIKDAVSFTIQYFPEKSYIDVWYFMGEDQANSSRYMFTYCLDEKKESENRQQILAENSNQVERQQMINEDVLLLTKINSSSNAMQTNRVVAYLLEVDGRVIRAVYTHKQDLVKAPTAAEVFADMYVEEKCR